LPNLPLPRVVTIPSIHEPLVAHHHSSVWYIYIYIYVFRVVNDWVVSCESEIWTGKRRVLLPLGNGNCPTVQKQNNTIVNNVYM
jgi:hypothetical protein